MSDSILSIDEILAEEKHKIPHAKEIYILVDRLWGGDITSKKTKKLYINSKASREKYNNKMYMVKNKQWPDMEPKI